MNCSPQLFIEWEPRWSSFKTSIGPALARSNSRLSGRDGKLLVAWEPWWRSFKSSVRPALARSPERLSGECGGSPLPPRAASASFLLHAAALLVVFTLPAWMARAQVERSPAASEYKYQVLYFSGNSLPNIADAGGAQSGRSGRAGGHTAFHPTQVIRVAGGPGRATLVVDAPKLNLPHSDSAVANLLAVAAASPGPPPIPSLRGTSSLSLRLPAELAAKNVAIAPAPRAERDKLASTPAFEVAAIRPATANIAREVAAISAPRLPTLEVVPPPISVPVRETTSLAQLTLPAPAIIEPPPSDVAREVSTILAATFAGGGTVIAPPVNASEVAGYSANTRGVFGGLGSAEVIAPSPATAGIGTGHSSAAAKVQELAGVGSATPEYGGNGNGGGHGTGGPAGFVISSQPGFGVGVPGGGGDGSLAMSPTGSGNSGLGGSGNGAGIGNGNGPGSGAAGQGPGSSTKGSGLGAGSSTHGGITNMPGPGGAGTGNGAMGTGVAVSGGKITLPSFATVTPPSVPGRSGEAARRTPPITIIATSRSGGALNRYGALNGTKVYTIYIDTRLGPAVLQYAEHASSSVPAQFETDLVPPEPVKSELPSEMTKTPVVIACVMDRAGALKNLRVLNARASDSLARLLEALESWRFRPVLRGDQAVEVDAILGFDIDTR